MAKGRKYPGIDVKDSDAKVDKEKIRKGGQRKKQWQPKKTAK